jgi:hypothetical protein
LFIRTLIKALDPQWIRPWPGNNVLKPVDCGSRGELIARFPKELLACLRAGGDTTLMVWADVDDAPTSPDELRALFWEEARQHGIQKGQFDQAIFVFARDRLENWIEYLNTGKTDEGSEGPRVRYPREAADAAKRLAQLCKSNSQEDLPESLKWSCANWRRLVRQMAK